MRDKLLAKIASALTPEQVAAILANAQAPAEATVADVLDQLSKKEEYFQEREAMWRAAKDDDRVLSVGLAFAALAARYIHNMPPTYEAVAALMIQAELWSE